MDGLGRHCGSDLSLVVQQARTDDDGDHAVNTLQLYRHAPKVAFQAWHPGRLSMRSSNAPLQPLRPPGERFTVGLRTPDVAGKP